MGFNWPGALKRAGIAAALLAGAIAVLPGHVGAQTATNANLYAVTAGSTGSGLVTISGLNQVAVTLNGVAPGAVYNVYTCTATVSTPTPPTCQIANGTLIAGQGGQATGTLASTINTSAVTEVFVQNASNTGELYAAVFAGAYPGYTTGYTTSPSCAAGSVVVFTNGFPSCSLSTSTGIACNYVNALTGNPICVPVGGVATYPWWYYLTGFGTLGANTTCIPGGGYQPVLVNGTIVYEFC